MAAVYAEVIQKRTDLIQIEAGSYLLKRLEQERENTAEVVIKFHIITRYKFSVQISCPYTTSSVLSVALPYCPLSSTAIFPNLTNCPFQFLSPLPVTQRRPSTFKLFLSFESVHLLFISGVFFVCMCVCMCVCACPRLFVCIQRLLYLSTY